MDQLILILELVGTLAFAASGAMTALKKGMDLFGVCILGLTTAVGGGVIRDVILGATPPATFQSPIYAVVALITSAVLFWPRLRQLFMWDPALYDLAMLVMDSAGLGIFTVMGIRIAYAQVDRPGWFLLVFVGVVTGVGGGVLRDVLAGDTPYIFVKHIYACASLAGAMVCTALWRPAGELPAQLAGAGTVLAIRFLSAHFHWNLPHADGLEKDRLPFGRRSFLTGRRYSFYPVRCACGAFPAPPNRWPAEPAWGYWPGAWSKGPSECSAPYCPYPSC